MTQTKPLVDIVNVVASATIDQKLDLNDITKKFPDVEYHPEQFPGAVFRLKTPKLQLFFSLPERWFVRVLNLKKWQ